MADSLNDKWKQAVKDYEAKLPPIEATSPLPLRPQLWNWVAALFGIVATASIGFALLPEQEAKPLNEAIASTAKSRPKQPEKSPSETYVYKLQVLSAGYRQQRDTDLTVDDPKTRIQSVVASFGTMGRIYNEGSGLALDKAGKEAQQEFIRLVGQRQARTFPKLRKMQGELFKSGFWENDIEVVTLGQDHSTLRLTGSMFAANRNIKAIFEALRPTLVGLRFKRVIFEWYRGSDQTYYTIGTVADDRVAEIKYETWIPVG